MKAEKIIIIFSLLSIISFSGSSQTFNSEIDVLLDVKSNGEFYEIVAIVDNLTEANRSLSYVFSTIKDVPNSLDKIKEDQTGRFIIEVGERKVIDKVSVNTSEENRVIVLFLLYDLNNTIVKQKRIVLNDIEGDEKVKRDIELKNKISKDLNSSGDDGILLRGIVLESTITKPGRDFFRLYSDKYNDKKVNGEKVIIVQEVIALGSNTKIIILVDNVVILESFINPRADYLSRLADEGITRTLIYFEQLKKNRNSLIKY